MTIRITTIAIRTNNNIISLADIRAQRGLPPYRLPEPEPPPEPPVADLGPFPEWRVSAKGNPWTLDEATQKHIVIFRDRDGMPVKSGWKIRLTPAGGPSIRYDRIYASAEEAKAAVVKALRPQPAPENSQHAAI